MGCVSSVEVAKGQRRVRPTPEARRAIRPMGSMEMRPGNSLDRFNAIVNGAKTIAAPSNMMPIVCLVKDAFPIITSMLHLEDSTPTEIHLPIMAGSVYNLGRIVAFAQLQFLSPKLLHSCDTAKVMVNALNWVSGSSSMINVCLLGFNKQSLPTVQKPLQELGFFAEPANSRTVFATYKAVVIPSDLNIDEGDLLPRLVQYVSEGGGLAVFYRHADLTQVAMPINKLLVKFGISFTYCLLNEELEDADSIDVPTSYQMIQESNFVTITGEFAAIVLQQEVDTSRLDDLVTTLRYYIMVCDEEYCEQMRKIAEAAWQFLRSHHYATEDGICPEIQHGIVVVLLQDLYSKLPISQVEVIPEHDQFPGPTGDVELEEFTQHLDILDDMWTPTGLWLPAGVEATVVCSEVSKDLCIRVGSHCRSLLTRGGPWKRWPSVVSIYPVEKEETLVGTAFGGIVYAAPNSYEPVDPFDVTLTFKNVCKYPRFVQGSPEIWEETKDLPVPWGEIETQYVVFTVPSDKMREIGEFDHLVKFYGDIMAFILNFVHLLGQARPYRIVFDVDADDEHQEPGEFYPLVFDLKDIDDLLINIDQPNRKLIDTLSLIIITSFRENCFDQITEKALSALVTAAALKSKFPDFDPENIPDWQPPILFKEFWEIHTVYDPELMSKTLLKYQDPERQVTESFPEDLWIAFVREMCRIGQRNFTELLEKSRPIPLNISLSLQGLPPYKPPQ